MKESNWWKDYRDTIKDASESGKTPEEIVDIAKNFVDFAQKEWTETISGKILDDDFDVIWGQFMENSNEWSLDIKAGVRAYLKAYGVLQ